MQIIFYLHDAIILQMKDLMHDSMKAIVPIILSALAAAAFTFAQSIASQAGFCPAPMTSPGETGLIASGIKAGHTAWHMLRFGTVA